MSQHRVSEHNSNDSEANTDSASMPQPDITRTIRGITESIVYPMVGPRCKTHYKEDFPDEEFKDGEGCLVCNTYEEVDEAVHKLVTLYQQGKIEEWENFRNAGFDPNKTLAQVLMYADTRIKELSQ